ncbi:MAG: DegT/DnrJ/EryC1/StrS family aminotransferase [candidate division WS1 bacterium]|mgnify:FL=1|nr:DegT/DnrJ/EryC1/StrS family aminotransferase [candidate division WS1 bacterium]
MSAAQLALLGGPKAVTKDPGDMFTWPIITQEDEDAVLEVLRRGAMSGTDVTHKFEEDFRVWHDAKYALGLSSGTAAIQSAMWACGVGLGSEIIAPSLTYWASALQAFSLQATIVFAEVDPTTLCLDPNDIEHRITERTKAIVPVHYCGYPAEMDAIMEIARKHNLKVIEDVSHAHGALYKGRLCGTIGDVGAFSVMSGKSLAVGEGGMLITDDRNIWERAMAWGHYERTRGTVWTGDLKEQYITDPELTPFVGLPWGGYKYRMHQLSSACGRVQLKHYKARMEEIQKAMNYFWDQLQGVPGVKEHRPAKDSGSTMGGWYASHGLYEPDELGGLDVRVFCKAVTAEGCGISPGANAPLHVHPLLNDADIYGHGKPTRIANSDRDLRQREGSLPVTEKMPSRCYGIPWFKHYRPEIIDEYAQAFKKVAENADQLKDVEP